MGQQLSPCRSIRFTAFSQVAAGGRSCWLLRPGGSELQLKDAEAQSESLQEDKGHARIRTGVAYEKMEWLPNRNARDPNGTLKGASSGGAQFSDVRGKRGVISL